MAPDNRVGPSMIIPSGVSSMVAPSARKLATVAAIRSDSLTRSSAASEMTVVPLAWVAATARMGISSMIIGISAPPIAVAVSRLLQTCRSPGDFARARAEMARDLPSHPLKHHQRPGAGGVESDVEQLDLGLLVGCAEN